MLCGISMNSEKKFNFFFKEIKEQTLQMFSDPKSHQS